MADPAEQRAAAPRPGASDHEQLRDSVAGEPALSEQFDPTRYARWLAEQRSRTTLAGNLIITLAVALASGPLAVAGALLVGRRTWWSTIYLVLLGPIVEELFKQAGMIYLLEKKPYRLFAAWQFIFAGAVSGLGFATVENLIYLHVYLSRVTTEDWQALAQYRWTWCTLLHVSCATVASLGLMRAWRQQLRDGQPAELARGFPWFFVAISIHGMYNLSALLVGPWLR